MITAETVQATLADIQERTKEDANYYLKRIAKFVEDEPQFNAYLMVMNGNTPVFDNPIMVALLAVEAYKSMREQQDAADKLSDQHG